MEFLANSLKTPKQILFHVLRLPADQQTPHPNGVWTGHWEAPWAALTGKWLMVKVYGQKKNTSWKSHIRGIDGDYDEKGRPGQWCFWTMILEG